MKIVINDICVLELTEIQEKVIKTYILSEEFQDDMVRRVREAVEGKYINCFNRLKNEWDSKLEASGINMIPTNKDEYSKLVFSQEYYRDRSTYESEKKAKQEALNK